MCAEYQINKQPVEIREWLKRHGESDSSDYRPRVKLFSHAPIVYGEEFRIESMSFSLKPPAMKFATFNARLYDFDDRTHRIVPMGEKRTWKKPLAESRCLVPMTGFVEPIYTGDHAGEMVEFEDTIQDMIFAAGVYEVSVDPKSGANYRGFSIIMDQPNDFIRSVGHHRQPVFLKDSAFEQWLSADLDSAGAMKVLATERLSLSLKVKTGRKMAKGWEKRIAAFQEKAAREAEIEALLKSAGENLTR